MASTERPMFHAGKSYAFRLFFEVCFRPAGDHFVCVSGDHMFQGGMSGYAMPYWNPGVFHHVNPYMNMYGNPGMMPFSAVSMVPATPYGVPPYGPSTYGSLPVPR